MDSIVTTLVVMGSAAIGLFVALAILYSDAANDKKQRAVDQMTRDIKASRYAAKEKK